jgi:hypothetical protein
MFHSETQKELAKWEQFPTKFVAEGLQPGNPYHKREYPKMLYKAHRTRTGKWAVADSAPAQFGFVDMNEWDRACQAAVAFTASCQKEVNSPEEQKALEAEGWRETQAGAMEYVEALDKAIGQAAAEANFRDRSMSEKALAEKAAFEAENFGHQPEIPEAPKRRGRKPKAAA